MFDDLLARGQGGTLILRIEDTDRSRYNPESEQEFIDSLAWVGIRFDEGPHVGGPHAPYRQSERKEAGIYQELIEKLLATGHAYRAFETPEELDQMREFQRINRMPTGYFGGEWRDASGLQVEEALAAGKSYVVRLKIPHGEKIKGHDAIRGDLFWDGETVDDPVLLKADGMPTYHFAAMVDDHLMEITHVLRGEEWIASFPKHIVLYQAFGWELPVFVHCPVIVGADGKKLSKRHGATRVLDYAAQGYLPQPLKNFVALIGWSPGDDREVMTDEELAGAFDINGIQPSPGRFDIEKLNWINGLAIRSMTAAELLEKLRDFLADSWTWQYWSEAGEDVGEADRRRDVKTALETLREAIERDADYVLRALPLEQERVSTLAELGPACEFFFVDEPALDQKAAAKAFAHAHARPLLEQFATLPAQDRSAAEWEAEVKSWAASHGIEKIGSVIQPIRVAMTGKMSGPGLFDLMSVLGPDRVTARFRRALENLT